MQNALGAASHCFRETRWRLSIRDILRQSDIRKVSQAHTPQEENRPCDKVRQEPEQQARVRDPRAQDSGAGARWVTRRGQKELPLLTK